MEKLLKAVSLQVTNVLGISEITIDLSGKVTEISGRNGQGKTSCIEALKSVLTSADSGTLLKNGATNGKAVLILNDGTQIVSSLKPGKSSKRAMFDSEGRTIAKGATHIAGLFDPHSLNPVDFLMAKGKARIDLLLQAMPIVIDRQKLNDIAGDRTDLHDKLRNKPNDEMDESFDGLLLISNVRNQLYELRTGDNRIAKDAEGTINTLRQSLAGAQPFDADRLAECNSIGAKIDGKLKEQIEGAKAIYATNKTAHESNINKAVEKKLALNRAYEIECKTLDHGIKADQEGIENSLNNAKLNIKGLKDQVELKKSSILIEIELLEAAKKAFDAQEVTRQSIKEMQEKYGKYLVSAGKLTKSMGDIDAYKAELLANMPIKGLTIDGDKLMLDDIIFDRVNTAKRVGVAMQLAKLRAGKLKMILVDGLTDIMDSNTLGEFYSQANESGCQIVTTSVNNGDLKVNNPQTTTIGLDGVGINNGLQSKLLQ